VNVTWEDVAGKGGKGGFCGWASRNSGIELCLPSMAQRDYAARDAGGPADWPWGNAFNDSSLWCSTVHRRAGTASVYRTTQVHESALGLVDVSGNVWEWCLDWFSHHDSRPLPTRRGLFGGRDEVVLTDPRGRPRGDFKLMGGGSWSDLFPELFRCSGRIWDLPTYSSDSVGFRLVSPAS
jgi:sulfatase modifying factor 1